MRIDRKVCIQALRNMGGEAAVSVHLQHDPDGDKLDGKLHFKGITVRVTLLTPFSWQEKEECATGEGVATTTARITSQTHDGVMYIANTIRDAAYDKALTELVTEMRETIKARRPGVSPKRIKRKVRATLTQFHSWRDDLV